MTTENYLNQRKSQRLEAQGGIAITPNGVCQIVNLNKDGVSFKCVRGLDFPLAWSMAIYDTTGQVLEQLHVKKIWENSLIHSHNSSPFSIEVGGEFQNLSTSQKSQLDTYLLQLLGMEE